jgi:hypothetical protein
MRFLFTLLLMAACTVAGYQYGVNPKFNQKVRENAYKAKVATKASIDKIFS